MMLTPSFTSEVLVQTRRSVLRAALAATTTALALGAQLASAQDGEPVVSKDAISVHRVEAGTMILRENARGTITSLTPPRVTVRLTPEQSAVVKAGQTCSVQIVAPVVLRGRVAHVRRDTLHDVTLADIELPTSLPAEAAIDADVGALIDVGTAEKIVYFERPASARPATTSTIFRLEPDGQHARRVEVVYGRLSGSQIEILRGLAPGDRVIVTDLPAVAGRDRVVLK